MSIHRRTTAAAIVAAVIVVAGVARPAAAQWQKPPESVIKSWETRVVTDAQKIRTTERDGINAFLDSLRASTCVKNKPQGLTTIGSFGQLLMNSRAKADQNLPNELGASFRGFLSVRPAPPIPGKLGSLTGESKINEHYSREANDAKAGTMGGLSQLMGCKEVSQTQTKLDQLRNQAHDALLNMMRMAQQNASK